MLEIREAVAVVTGGSGGIGYALAKEWGNRGGKVVLADIAAEALAGETFFVHGGLRLGSRG
jgi:3-oxoacyl-[acyl-carrier protein] reductase